MSEYFFEFETACMYLDNLNNQIKEISPSQYNDPKDVKTHLQSVLNNFFENLWPQCIFLLNDKTREDHNIIIKGKFQEILNHSLIQNHVHICK